MKGLVKVETSLIINGTGKFDITGVPNIKETKESVKTAQQYFKANSKQISASISVENRDYLLNVQDCQGIGICGDLSIDVLVAYCSCALNKPVLSQLCILGSVSIGGTINKVENLSDVLQVCFDAGAKKVLLPMSSANDIPSVPADLFSKFQILFYDSPEDCVVKALGLE